MLLNLEPPLGFGNKCPQYLAYKRFMKFNMPLDEKGRCHFTTTLFSLIRESLKIKILNFEEASEADMDEADNQLRAIIKKLWPFTEQEKFGLCVPYKHGNILIKCVFIYPIN
jgi:voltage-dependent calcium channel N type alpha-1B